MERRHQRSALPTLGNIAPAEIGYRGDTGFRRNAAGVPDLHAEWRVRRGGVKQCLSMTADGTDLRGRQPGFGSDGECGLGERVAERRVELAERLQRDV